MTDLVESQATWFWRISLLKIYVLCRILIEHGTVNERLEVVTKYPETETANLWKSYLLQESVNNFSQSNEVPYVAHGRVC